MFLLIFFLSAVYIFVFSESGILERMNYRSKRALVEQRIEAMKTENTALSGELERLGRGSFTDIELYRAGLVRKDGKLLFLGSQTADRPAEESAVPENRTGAFETHHMRILWVVLSVLILLVYAGTGYRKSDA